MHRIITIIVKNKKMKNFRKRKEIEQKIEQKIAQILFPRSYIFTIKDAEVNKKRRIVL